MAKGLQIAEPPQRNSNASSQEIKAESSRKKTRGMPASGVMFTQIAEDEKVQFNKRIKRGVADGYEILAIRTRKKVPDLLDEALGLLEEKYGKV